MLISYAEYLSEEQIAQFNANRPTEDDTEVAFYENGVVVKSREKIETKYRNIKK